MRVSLQIGRALALSALVASIASAQSPRADISWLAGGHIAPISSAAYSPDGKMLASSGYFGDTMKVWRASDGAMVRTFRNSAGANEFIFGPMEPITFLPDGKHVVALGEGSAIGVWNVANGSLLRLIHVQGSDLAVSHDGTLIAVAANTTIKLVRFSDGVVVRTINWSGDFVQAIAFSHDDTVVAGGDRLGILKTFRVSDGGPLLSIQAHPDYIYALRYTPDGTKIASGSRDNTIKLWNSTSGDPAGTLIGHADAVTSLAFSANGNLLASGSGDHTAKLWSMPGGILVGTLNQPADVRAVSFNSVTNRIAVASATDLEEWDVSSQTFVRSLTRATNRISGTAFTPDSTKIVSSSHDGKVSVHDVNTGALLRQMVPGGNSFAVATSAETIAAATNAPNVVKLYRLSDGMLLRTLVPTGSLPYTYSLVFSPDGATLATGHFNNQVQLWNVSDGSLIRTLPGQSGAINGIAYTLNGAMLVAASSGGYVHVWDAAGNLIRTMGPVGEALTSVAVSPDNQFVLAGGETGRLQLWRLDNGAFVYSFIDESRISDVCFAPSGFAFYAGRTMSALNSNGSVRIYRTSDHALLDTYSLETGGFGNNPTGPLDLAVSPNGQRFSYGRDDATVVMAYNTLIAAPISATLFAGQIVSGSFQDLVITDGAGLVARPGVNGDRQSAPVQLDIVAHLPLPNPLRLSFQIAATANFSGLEQEVWMRNAQNGTFELIDTRPAATIEQTLRLLLGPNIVRYIDASGNVTARVKWFSPSQNVSRSWQISVDQAIWAVGL
jgi:WD40 repeat protein